MALKDSNEVATLRERLGRAGRALVERRYDWRAVAQDMLAVYDGLVTPAPGARP